MILAGDIGGTNARLALFGRGDLSSPLRLDVVPSQEFPDLETILERFLGAQAPDVDAATFGIAGPVREGRSKPTNLRWGVDASTLAPMLGLRSVGLINDLEATTWGLESLSSAEVVARNDAVPDPCGNVGVIAAGTGLGEAGLVHTDRGRVPFATESGHAGFAPATSDQLQLIEFLRGGDDGPVSIEVVCSGNGLVNIYRFCLHDVGRSEPAWLADEAEQGDPAAAIAGIAEDGSDDAARRALAMFIAIYGSEAGNLALRLLARGGIYVAGGIAPKLVDSLLAGGFMDAFVNKPPLSDLLRTVPVRVVVNDRVALLGAARHAASHGEDA